MSQYQKVEYRIGTDGQITETVLNAEGPSCTANTTGMEAALGSVIHQDLLPEYYTEGSDLQESQAAVVRQTQSA
jgi:hypothetical protein